MITLWISQAKRGTKIREPTKGTVVTSQTTGSLPSSVVNYVLSFFDNEMLKCFEMVIINADSLFFGFVFDSEVLQGVLWPSYNISLNTLPSWWNFAAAPVLLQ